MIYHILADLIVALHLAYVLYVVVGQLLIWIGIPMGWKWIRNPWFRFTHLLMILIVAAEATIGMSCPLTDWENDFLRRAGAEVHDRSFIGRILHDTMFFDCPDTHPAFFYAYVGFGLIVLATFVLWPPRPLKSPLTWFTSKTTNPETGNV